MTGADRHEDFLAPGDFVDSSAPEVLDFVRRACGDLEEREDPVATASRAYCVPKAVLLAAAARAGIPAGLGFADVRNHLQTPGLRERMNGSELFVFHGYAQRWLRGRWVKATPAFNTELCERFGVAPMEFDGSQDALLHEFSADGGRHMEYVRDRGSYTDLPFDEIMHTFREHYSGSFVSGRTGDDEFTR